MRYKATDVVDVWRCLEVGFAAGVKPSEFADGQPAEAAAIIWSLFATARGGRPGDRHQRHQRARARDSRGMNDLIAERRLSKPGADQRYIRLRALVTRVLGAG